MSIVKNLPFEYLVGIRYTRAGKRSGRNSFISFISLISMAGIALGVAALIVVLSIMNGFQKDVTDRMLSVLASIEIFDASGALPNWQATAKEAMQDKDVVGTAPYVMSQAMLTHDEALRGIVVRGVLPSGRSHTCRMWRCRCSRGGSILWFWEDSTSSLAPNWRGSCMYKWGTRLP